MHNDKANCQNTPPLRKRSESFQLTLPFVFLQQLYQAVMLQLIHHFALLTTEHCYIKGLIISTLQRRVPSPHSVTFSFTAVRSSLHRAAAPPVGT